MPRDEGSQSLSTLVESRQSLASFSWICHADIGAVLRDSTRSSNSEPVAREDLRVHKGGFSKICDARSMLNARMMPGHEACVLPCQNLVIQSHQCQRYRWVRYLHIFLITNDRFYGVEQIRVAPMIPPARGFDFRGFGSTLRCPVLCRLSVASERPV